jgi:hypothetical protein
MILEPPAQFRRHAFVQEHSYATGTEELFLSFLERPPDLTDGALKKVVNGIAAFEIIDQVLEK